MAEGRIQKALSGFYYVDTGAEVLTCRARGKFRKEGLSPLVGDRVTVRELGNGEGFVESILPRKNAFERPAVANIDQLIVIGSAAIPNRPLSHRPHCGHRCPEGLRGGGAAE